MKVEVLDPNKWHGTNGRNGTVLASLSELEKHFGPNTFIGSDDDKVSHQYAIKVGNKIVCIWAYKYNPIEYSTWQNYDSSTLSSAGTLSVNVAIF